MNQKLSLACLILLGITLEIPACAQSVEDSIGQVRSALRRGDYAQAGSIAEKLASESDDPKVDLFAADSLLRSGRSKAAVPLFDEYLKSEPAAKPYLWQRGIALYFAGDFDAGAQQFEVHRTVNPNDVENAAWHYLCVCKGKSVERANQNVLPAPNDRRIPMDEVLRMLRTGDKQTVIDKIDSTDASTSSGQSARFYGYLYLGLYADALGDHDEAERYMVQSAKDAPRHYMGDIARVYLKHLQDNPPTE